MKAVFSIIALLVASQGFAETFTVDANYNVPVGSDLAPYAGFKLKNSTVTLDGNSIQLAYQLPLEIVNPEIHNHWIKLSGTTEQFPKHFEVSDQQREYIGSCLLRTEGVTCLVSYDFQTDLNTVLNYVRTTFPSNEVGPRSEVARVFNGEAGGIVHFPVKLNQ